jgi:methyltransferase-like protein
LDLGPDLGPFDYIIAHGVYSWVDAPARDKLLVICRAHLARHGVAYVSYNVYPGWHVHDMFRSMMTYQARGVQGIAAQTDKGRMLLEFLKASMSSVQTPYQALIGAELEPFLQQTDAGLRNDLLAKVSFPVYFQQFIAHAQSHGLQFLGDCTQGIRYADSLSVEIEQELSAVTNDGLRKTQYRDILQKKTFRQTLLCHAEIDVQQSPAPQLLEGLHIEARIRPENPDLTLRSTNVERFYGSGDATVSTGAPIIKAALLHLGTIWPKSLRWEELVAAVQSRMAGPTDPPPTISPTEIKRLADNLIECCCGGIVDLHVKPHSFTTTLSERPAASPLARWQAARGEVVTNRRHAPVRLDQFDRQVLQLLDGSRDLSQLVDQLAEWASQGRISVIEGQRTVESPQRVRQLIELTLPQGLARLRENAFLVD